MFRLRLKYFSIAVASAICLLVPHARAQDNEPVTFTLYAADGRAADVVMHKVGSPQAAIDFVSQDIASGNQPDQVFLIDKTGEIDSDSVSHLMNKPDFSLITGDVAPLVKAIDGLEDLHGKYPDMETYAAYATGQKAMRERAREHFFHKFGWGVTILKATVSGVATYMAFDSWFEAQFVPTFMLATVTALIGGWYLRNVNEIVADCYALSDKVFGSINALKRFSGPLTGNESKMNLAMRKLGVMTAAFTFVATIYYSSWTAAFLGLSAYYVPGKLIGAVHEFGATNGMGDMSMAMVTTAFIGTRLIVASYQETIADVGPTLTVKAILNRMNISETTRRMSLQIASAVIGAFSSFLVMASNFAAIGSVKVVVKWATRVNLVCFLFSDIFTKEFRAEFLGKVRARVQAWSGRHPTFINFVGRSAAAWNDQYEKSLLHAGLQAVRARFTRGAGNAAAAPTASVASTSGSAAVATPNPRPRCLILMVEHLPSPPPPRTYFVDRYRRTRAAIRRWRQ